MADTSRFPTPPATNKRLPELDNDILFLLTRAHEHIMQGPRGGEENRNTYGQAVICTFCCMVWGKEGWQQTIIAARKMAVLEPDQIAIDKVDGEKDLAIRFIGWDMLKEATDRISKVDEELAEVLRWCERYSQDWLEDVRSQA